MRKYKQIKRKEVIFDLKEWELIEKWAARFNITTSEYIRQATLTDKVTIARAPEEWALLINTLKKIGTNINQLAKKARNCTVSTPMTTKK
ncbi:MAG: plasmid mobilization relaxosome protein MobC [Ruminiclostridium sp.]|nr:plasmid mobilization relaxosome protein MobC [Ruminiclostridium sp.]